MNRLLELLASRKTAIVLLVAAVAGSLIKAQTEWGNNYLLIAILVALSVNLVVCLIRNSRRIWRRSKPLYIFHIGLIGLSVSALISGLTYYNGYFELAEGQSINNEFLFPRQGPLYRDKLQGFQIALEQSEIEFHAQDFGVLNDKQHVAVKEPGRVEELRILRYNQPLLYEAYRFYLTQRQGYSLIFKYTDAEGRPDSGVINMPEYPENRHRQIFPFRTPDKEAGQMSARLILDSWPHKKDEVWQLTAPQDATVDIAYFKQGKRVRASLRIGDTIQLSKGTLMFEDIRLWHGFMVDYDPVRPYLALSSLLLFIGMTWHYGKIAFYGGKAARTEAITREETKKGES